MSEPRLIGNRYEVGALIGYGGMAEVHIGRDVRLGRTVALKILRSDLARDPSFQTRFRREAQAAGSLNHPAIVAVYDSGESMGPDGPVPFIVMEYVDGRTLRDVLSTEKRLEPRWAMEVVAEVCAALDFSHRHGIIHRDVKPANVMITKDGAVKVMDFGIARALADGSATVTQTAAVIGTAQYLSPEQARGEAVDARSDVYSTGCLLYELVVGHPPFQGDSPVAVAYQHVRENPAVPSTVNPAVPRALDSIVMKALAKNPLNRYQSAAEMRADLQRAISEVPVRAEPVLNDEERTQLIVGAGGRHALPPGGDPDASPGPGRRTALLWVAGVLVLLLVIAGASWALLRDDGSKNAKPTTTTTVPNLIGMRSAIVESTLQGKSLTLQSTPEHVTSCAVKTVAVGSVCTQSPDPNSVVNVNTSVAVTIYDGPTMVTVPFVTDGQIADATAQLTAKGFTFKATPVASNKASGIVLTQNPPGGTSAVAGSLVILTYSSGQLTVTDVTGLAFNEAAAKLNQAGFQVNQTPIAETNTDPKRVGLVSRTNPARNSVVPATTPITIYVWGPVPVKSCSTTAAPSGSASSSSPAPSGSTAPTTC